MTEKFAVVVAPEATETDRSATGLAAEAAGAQAVIMDDGFQDPDLATDLSLVVVGAVAIYRWRTSREDERPPDEGEPRPEEPAGQPPSETSPT